MNNKETRYLMLILFIAVLVQRPLTVAGSIGIVTPSTAEKMKTDIREADVEKKDDRDDIIQVVMPVDVDHVFDFIMDPQQLIEKTDAIAYDGERFEKDATLFFKRTQDGVESNYRSSSDPLTIINKGNIDVKVILTARISFDSTSGITMSDDPEFSGIMTASLYLALTDGETTVPINSENDVVIETEIPGVSKGETPNQYSFQLIGAVNKVEDWSKMTDVMPEVTVTWMVSSNEENISNQEKLEEEEWLFSKGENGEQERNNLEGNLNGVEESMILTKSGLTQNKEDLESSMAVEQIILEEGNTTNGDGGTENEGSSTFEKNIEEGESSVSKKNNGDNESNVLGENSDGNGSDVSEENSEESRSNVSGKISEKNESSGSEKIDEVNGSSTSGENGEENKNNASNKNIEKYENDSLEENTGVDKDSDF